ncbi:hypothetical protein FA10DRAFT_124928 [Acaromyces ingoldii]|uniref:Uncharacterized protein n=1 Tax=Acaromyces ingoldii TaxID=215250 RepID=A0A316YNT5_9BASI|nr:hypothetical protein FA10DRAFT_124928 [Acaromyces ingoldii]PWN90822.1 hypothetical protein FA10DRAFT_124928 [Acaromyces ingoldii]
MPALAFHLVHRHPAADPIRLRDLLPLCQDPSFVPPLPIRYNLASSFATPHQSYLNLVQFFSSGSPYRRRPHFLSTFDAISSTADFYFPCRARFRRAVMVTPLLSQSGPTTLGTPGLDLSEEAIIIQFTTRGVASDCPPHMPFLTVIDMHNEDVDNQDLPCGGASVHSIWRDTLDDRFLALVYFSRRRFFPCALAAAFQLVRRPHHTNRGVLELISIGGLPVARSLGNRGIHSPLGGLSLQVAMLLHTGWRPSCACPLEPHPRPRLD